MDETLDYNMKLPMTHERYRIPGLNAFSMSAWSRENEPKELPRFKVGDVVAVLVIAEVTKVYEDCDGTPLYTIDGVGNGISEGGYDIRLATPDEADSI